MNADDTTSADVRAPTSHIRNHEEGESQEQRKPGGFKKLDPLQLLEHVNADDLAICCLGEK